VVPTVGDKIRLIEMVDDPNPLPTGSVGVVQRVTRLGEFTQVDVDWESGRSLTLTIPPDSAQVIE
jgi:hypothetical protein